MNTAAQNQERQGETAMMVVEGLAAMSFDAMLDVVEAHIEARPDVDHEKLDRFCNRRGRQAWRGLEV